MALYLGNSEKLRITLSNGKYALNIPSISAPSTSGVRLLSFDNYILKDSNGLYLTAKEAK